MAEGAHEVVAAVREQAEAVQEAFPVEGAVAERACRALHPVIRRR